MNRFEIEIAKMEVRTPLFYYPYHIEIKSELAKEAIAFYFFKKTTTYELSFRKSMVPKFITEENLKDLSGQYVFHYDDSKETEWKRIEQVRNAVPKVMANRGVDGFLQYKPGVRVFGHYHLVEGKDFEVIVGDRVDIEQPNKHTFDDIPDLMGVND